MQNNVTKAKLVITHYIQFQVLYFKKKSDKTCGNKDQNS